MNKVIVAACLLASLIISMPAVAGDYTHSLAVNTYCRGTAGFSSDTYLGRVAGKSKQEFIDQAQHILKDNDVGSEILLFAINYGYDQATSQKDAYMTSWANCMDKLDN